MRNRDTRKPVPRHVSFRKTLLKPKPNKTPARQTDISNRFYLQTTFQDDIRAKEVVNLRSSHGDSWPPVVPNALVVPQRAEAAFLRLLPLVGTSTHRYRGPAISLHEAGGAAESKHAMSVYL